MASCLKRACSRPRPWSRQTTSPVVSRLARRAASRPSSIPFAAHVAEALAEHLRCPPAAPCWRSGRPRRPPRPFGRLHRTCRSGPCARASASRRSALADSITPCRRAQRLVEDIPPRVTNAAPAPVLALETGLEQHCRRPARGRRPRGARRHGYLKRNGRLAAAGLVERVGQAGDDAVQVAVEHELDAALPGHRDGALPGCAAGQVVESGRSPPGAGPTTLRVPCAQHHAAVGAVPPLTVTGSLEPGRYRSDDQLAR